MKHYALIGRTLTHSHSKRLFDAQGFSDADYRLHPMPSLERLREWVAAEGIDGFNVTNPYKQAVIPLLDEMSPEARAIGAVNCVSVDGGRLTGYNTDAPAFRDTLSSFLSPLSTLHAAYILGTGGAAHAVAYALTQMGIPYTFVSRTPRKHPDAIGYPQLSSLLSPLPTLLVNATPVGTYPDIDASPLPSNFQLSTFNFQFLYDLVYNPSPTLLLRQAAAAGAATCDGTAMLRRQAELSWDIWGLRK
ncbi:MAG: shikimate dehydrogenase [Bacteroidales bacterium]|nr:shikimate dehydrogenase [Bacteroidales bacterium]